ncbi:hypothetical protein C8R47DRAFT_1087792 [Mycena vitilis]|nr:hypothetical protein C8R47DRAFT_1087792 [Mycena vitilis]
MTFMIAHQMRLQRVHSSLASQSTGNSNSSGPRFSKHPVVRFRWMIIRIALYPLLSCFLSTTACVLDVYSVQHTEVTNFTFTLGTTNLFIYCLRPLLYTLLAATPLSGQFARCTGGEVHGRRVMQKRSRRQ